MDENTRFRRALKSPLVMVGLCIFAGMAVYHNVIDSTMNFTQPFSVVSTESPAASVPTTSAPSPVRHNDVATQWIDNPTRDPFAPMSGTTWSKPSTNQSTSFTSPNQKPHTPSPSSLTLKAVAVEAQQRSAVINRQMVYEGEMIEGYQVVTIQLNGVWLKRHGKKEFLTFATNTSS